MAMMPVFVVFMILSECDGHKHEKEESDKCEGNCVSDVVEY